MTVDELINHIKDVDHKTEYQHEKNCPAEPITFGDSSRSFLGDISCQSNVIGKDDNRVLRTFCFNAK